MNLALDTRLDLRIHYDIYSDPHGLGGILDKVAKVVKDVVKVGVQPIASTISSVTGKKIDLNYDTKAGKAAGGAAAIAVESTNALAKRYADAVTGNLATKAANVLRDDEYKEKPGEYYETRNQVFESGILSKVEKASEAGALIVGTVAAAIYGGPVSTVLNTVVPLITKPETQLPVIPAPVLPPPPQQVFVVQQEQPVQQEGNKVAKFYRRIVRERLKVA